MAPHDRADAGGPFAKIGPAARVTRRAARSRAKSPLEPAPRRVYARSLTAWPATLHDQCGCCWGSGDVSACRAQAPEATSLKQDMSLLTLPSSTAHPLSVRAK